LFEKFILAYIGFSKITVFTMKAFDGASAICISKKKIIF